MPSAVPTIKERAQGDRPVAVKPRRHKLFAAGSPESLFVRLNVDVNVIVDLGWDEYPLQTGHIVPDDYIAQRCRIDVASSDPLVSWPARIPCRAEPDRHARGRPERRHQLHNRRRRRECTDFLDVEPRVVVPLVEFSVGVALKIGEAKPPPFRRPPHLVGFMIRPAHKAVDGPRTLNRLD